MESLKEIFDKIVPVSASDWEFFKSGCRQKVFPKGCLILEQGAVENKLSFVETGLMRHFIPNEKGGITTAFVFAGAFSSAYESFLLRQPSE